jgi:hypothetical protein
VSTQNETQSQDSVECNSGSPTSQVRDAVEEVENVPVLTTLEVGQSL